MRRIWKSVVNNKEFPAVFSFLLSLGIVQIMVLLGIMSFDFVLPWITLVFIWYGLSEKTGVIGIVRRWRTDKSLQQKAFAASALIDTIFLLAFFPGVMEYDSYVQMCQVYGEPYSNHHPWPHTMLIKLIYQFGQSVLGSNNRAFAPYSLFSICMLSFAFAGVIAFLRYKGVKGRYLVILGAIYLLSPINQMYSITMWKDIPFAVSVILFMLLLCLLKDEETKSSFKRVCWILLIPVSFCVCFFRSNGLYVFLGMIPFLIWALWKQKKAVIAVIGVVLLLGAVYKGPVFDYFEVEEPDMIESLSIPAQQIAAVVANEGTISEEQRELLSRVIDLEKVPEAYFSSPGCSDAIKELVRETDNQQYIVDHAAEFFKTWVQLFGAAPEKPVSDRVSACAGDLGNTADRDAGVGGSALCLCDLSGGTVFGMSYHVEGWQQRQWQVKRFIMKIARCIFLC